MYELIPQIRPRMRDELARKRQDRFNAFLILVGVGASMLLAATTGAMGAKALLWMAGLEYYGP